MSTPNLKILAGDVGGTNTRLSVWTIESKKLTQIGHPVRFKNVDYKSLCEIVTNFGSDQGLFTDVCIGIAGPVDERRVRMTNIAHWPEVTADDLAKALRISDAHRVNLLNDMPAHAWSLQAIEDSMPEQLKVINAGNVRPKGTRAIIMPGTGFGAGFMVWDEHLKAHRPMPAEGGHEQIAARNDEETALFASMRTFVAREGQTSLTREMLVSGRGLRAIYACLRDPKNPTLDEVPKSEEFVKLERTDRVAKKTLDMFVNMLAGICGDAAFGYLATGGLYLGGSIANSLADRIQSPLFQDVFKTSGPTNLRQLIGSIPVKLVCFQETGLLGAASCAVVMRGH
ncbi:MAG TPA: ROK family protein [Tepidisphaeraceae bacterium]|nr:ROK family protein [Tepidisphaeraceae bacterium]